MRYSRHYRRRPRPWLPYAVIVGLLLLSAYWAGNRFSGQEGEPQQGDDPPLTGPTQAEASGLAPDRITPETALIYVTQYASTGRVEERVSAPPESMLDLTREALAVMYPQWQIETFSSEQVVFRRVDNGVDPVIRQEEEQRYRTLALRDGQIVVLAGRPHPEAGLRLADLTLLRETDIDASHLRADDAERLSAGVVVEGDEEVARNLEGYLN